MALPLLQGDMPFLYPATGVPPPLLGQNKVVVVAWVLLHTVAVAGTADVVGRIAEHHSSSS